MLECLHNPLRKPFCMYYQLLHVSLLNIQFNFIFSCGELWVLSETILGKVEL